MNPITNSVVKEQIRQRNENAARTTEQLIQSQLASEISQLRFKNKYTAKPFLIGGGIVGLLFIAAVGINGILVGIVLGLFIWLGLNANVSNYNNSLEEKKNSLQRDAQARIAEAYGNADRKTTQEINAYDAEVKMYSQKILKNAESISPMVDHVVNMFQRMISHADAGAHMRFVETDFTYQVLTSGINYSYQSRYTNPQDDYNFNKERYRDLKSDAECEGLAQALAKLSISKLKTLYPANSVTTSVSHIDAKVTIHFKGANANFIPARDIL